MRRGKAKPESLDTLQCDQDGNEEESKVDLDLQIETTRRSLIQGADEPMTSCSLSSSNGGSFKKGKSGWTKQERLELESLEIFNVTQMKALEMMRTECALELDQIESHEDITSDRRLLRFLRGHKFDMATACQMYKNMLQWRQEQNIDAIREEIISKNLEPKDFPHHGRVVRFLPLHQHHGYDLEGRPVQIKLVGRIDTKKLLSSFQEEEFLRYHIYGMEYSSLLLDQLSKERKSMVRTVLIFDLAGLNMSHVRGSAMDLLRKALKITQDYYPESMHRCYILNAPKVFSMFWQVIKPLLAERTVRKVQVLGSSYQADLLSTIPAESLPVSLGGSRPDVWPLVFDKNEAAALDEDYEQLVIPKGASKTLEVTVPPSSYVVWGFFAQSGDVVFSSKFTDSKGAIEQNNPSVANEGKFESLAGSFESHCGGTLSLTFDNSTSWVKSKNISYYTCIAPLNLRQELDSPRKGKLRQFFASPSQS